MAGENDDRDSLPFKMGELQDLGITSTERIINAGEAFLNGNIDEITPITNKEQQDNNDNDEEDGEDGEVITKTKTTVKTPTKTTPQQKTTSTKTESKLETKKEVSDDDILNLLSGETNEETNKDEDNEDDEAIVVNKKDKKPAKTLEQKLPVTTKQETQTDDNDPEAIYNSITEELVNQGVFAPDEDEEGNEVVPQVKDAEEFLELFQLNARRTANEILENFLNSRGDAARDIFDNIINKGVDPREYISRYAKVQDFKNLDLTNEDNQEKVVREFYRQAGLTPESVDKKVKQLKDHSELANEAEEAQKVVVKREEDNMKLLTDQKAKADADKARVRVEYVNSLAKILNEKAKAREFDGIPIPDNKTAQEVFNDLTVEKYTLGEQLLTEFDKDILELNRPNNHPIKVKVALLMRMMKTDPKLLSLSKKVVSKESSKLFQGLQKRNNKAGTSANKEEDSKGGNKAGAPDKEEITSWYK